MTHIELPVILVAKLYHIGTLDKEKKGIHYPNSLEANCLSVSNSPHAWQQIAKLGGYPLHRLFKEKGIFLDANYIKKSKYMSHILDFGRKNRLIKQVKRYRAWEFDVEREEWIYSLFNTKEEAQLELGIVDLTPQEVRNLDRPKGHQLIEYITVNIAAQKLQDLLGLQNMSDDATDALIVAYGQFTTDIDGVYWDEIYDPDNLSAPRAGIFPNRLSQWSIAQTQFDDVEDKATIILKQKGSVHVHSANL